jgi:lysophospholipase L1-like esterase
LVTLLCFGDSNTWGFNPATWERYPQDIRWPGVLQNELGESYRVIEDGQNGRTAVEGKAFAGFNSSVSDLISTLANHGPFDLIILMLGTNDLLMRSSVSPDDVGKGIDVLLEVIHHSGAGPGSSAPAALLLAPPPIGSPAGETATPESAVTQSHLFAKRYASIAADFGCAFLNTGEIVCSSEIDGSHLDASEHTKLGLAVAKRVRMIFASVG